MAKTVIFTLRILHYSNDKSSECFLCTCVLKTKPPCLSTSFGCARMRGHHKGLDKKATEQVLERNPEATCPVQERQPRRSRVSRRKVLWPRASSTPTSMVMRISLAQELQMRSTRPLTWKKNTNPPLPWLQSSSTVILLSVSGPSPQENSVAYLVKVDWCFFFRPEGSIRVHSATMGSNSLLGSCSLGKVNASSPKREEPCLPTARSGSPPSPKQMEQHLYYLAPGSHPREFSSCSPKSRSIVGIPTIQEI